MSDRQAGKDKSTWAIGGGLLLGLGAGFFFLPSGLAFVGSLLGGLGIGLMLASIIAAFCGGAK